MHIELVSYSATQPNTSGAAAAFTGDSLTIKNSKGAAKVISIWAFNQVEGFHQIAFPSGHDTTRGWRSIVEANSPTFRLPNGLPMEVQPQELMTITIAGSNTAGDVETGHMLVHYDDLPGVTQRLATWERVQAAVMKGAKQTTVQATITGTAAGYSGAELINAESDLLRANSDYALVGIETSTPVGAVTIVGPDTGNVKIGVPGDALNSQVTAGFFGLLSRALNMATIPIINSGNKNSTFIGVAANENAGATIVSLNLVLLP